MRLYGFQCDHCGAKSRNKPGQWLEVTVMSVQQDGESWTALDPFRSDGTHYCSRKCLVEAMSIPTD